MKMEEKNNPSSVKYTNADHYLQSWHTLMMEYTDDSTTMNYHSAIRRFRTLVSFTPKFIEKHLGVTMNDIKDMTEVYKILGSMYRSDIDQAKMLNQQKVHEILDILDDKFQALCTGMTMADIFIPLSHFARRPAIVSNDDRPQGY